MLNELKKNILRLRRDESGVALMLTMSVILFLYVLCSGVYAVGETVREKIELQEACDSAAYSAAVVQADGLSRMAMINRALSWTYVQLTRMQLDFITHEWLGLVLKRFDEDKAECKDWADNSTSGCFSNCGDCEDWFTTCGQGWFCGVYNFGFGGHDRISINGSSLDYSTIRNGYDSSIEMISSYRKQIPELKKLIEALNGFLGIVNQQMNDSINETVMATLYANLPRKRDGEIDETLAREFQFRFWRKAGASPYPADDSMIVEQSGYFSALFNTEAGERQFLCMADGEVHEDLLSYFKSPDEPEEEAGGLDQWFVRSYAEEANIDSRVVSLDLLKSFKNFGICRVYKNSNRQYNLDDRNGTKRGHHVNIKLLDTPPSCNNDPMVNIGQCPLIPGKNKAALYADYEWRSSLHCCVCWTSFSWRGVRYRHAATTIPMIGSCKHHCHRGVMTSSHSRGQYNSCFQNVAIQALHISGLVGNCSYPKYFLEITPPYGYARIYGDDKDIYDPVFYTGAVAKPWVLNERFYGNDGAIVIALARKQRNPWQRLIGAALGVNEAKMTNGIYSAFSPAAGENHIVAFSAARAAHRYHPSQGAIDYVRRYDDPNFDIGGVRDYETRYDAVIDNIEIQGDLKDVGIGCVCGRDNALRYARCWNLCETDWSATLIPVRFAYEKTDQYYDSHIKNQVAWTTGEGENVFRGAVVIEESADGKKNGWFPLVDDAGKFIGLQGDGIFNYARNGAFLRAVLSTDPQAVGMSGYKEIFGEVDLGDGELRRYKWKTPNSGKRFMIESDDALKKRIL